MIAIESLPTPLVSYMQRFARRWMWQRLMLRAGLAVLAFLVMGLLVCLVDRVTALDGALRTILLLADLALVATILWPAWTEATSRNFDWRQLAQQMERRDPLLGERLVTVISRLLGNSHYVGSRGILDRLARDLASEVRGRDIAPLLPARSIARPWIAVAAVATVALGLALIPVLDLPSLAMRFVLPLSKLRPVTTTQLVVDPGNVNLVEGQSLVVRVSARRLRGAPMLKTRRAGQDWNTIGMSSDAGGTFVSALGDLDEDLDYVVSGGDATSELYTVRILRKPVVTGFSIHYEYPAYARLSPLDVSNSTGLIEGPLGTKATIRLRASEPLAAATMTVGEQTVSMRRPETDPNVREGTITITRDVKYQLGLGSTGGMVGAGPEGAMVRVVADKPPEVRMLWPSDDLWVQAGAIITIGYAARDDLGLALLEVHARVNPFGSDAADPAQAQPPGRIFRPPVDLPVRRKLAQLRDVGEVQVDLGALNLRSGDFATLRLRAQDGNGQSALSETLHVVVCPRSVSDSGRRQLTALRQALQIAEQASEPEMRNVHELKTWLLRALMCSTGGGDADAIERLVDSAAEVDAMCAAKQRQAPDPNQLQLHMARLADAMRRSYHARLAAMLLSDRANIATVRRTLPLSSTPPASQSRRRVELLEARCGEALRHLQIGENDPQLLTRLQEMAGTDSYPTAPPNYADSAARWYEALARGQRDGIFVSRLETAARAQLVRADGDPIWARDLWRAATAAGNIELGAVGGAGFSAALSTVQRDYSARRAGEDGPSQQAESDDAATARQQLAEWASETPANGPRASPASRQMEGLALQACGETAVRNYSNALAIDRALSGEATAAARESTASQFAGSESERQMDLVQALDSLVLQQEDIGRQIELSPDLPSIRKPLAERQAQLAASTEALLGSQNRLDEHERLDAAQAVDTLAQWLGELPGNLSQRQRWSASSYELEEQEERIRAVAASLIRFLGNDGSARAAQLRERLLPAVFEIRSATQDTREAPATVLEELPTLARSSRDMLLDALDDLLQPDPLLAGSFHAARAAEMLRSERRRRTETLQETGGGAIALRRAWQQAVHRAALARGIRTAELARVVWPLAWEDDQTQWTGAQAPQAKPIDPGPAPAGYENAVDAFLQATGQRKIPVRAR